MRHFPAFSALMLLAAFVAPVSAADGTFEGTWRTTNRKLDGTMRCVVTELGDQQWQGRFYGVWRGVAFDYTVPFTGSTSELRGTATIDGADYTWTGRLGDETPKSFQGSFTGNRYNGFFDLKEMQTTATNRRGQTMAEE